MANSKLSLLRQGCLALLLGMLAACSAEEPRNEPMPAPGEPGSTAEDARAPASVEASDATGEEPSSPAAEGTEPASEEGVDPAQREGVEPSSEEGVEPAGADGVEPASEEGAPPAIEEVVAEGGVVETGVPEIAGSDIPSGDIEPVLPTLDDPGLAPTPTTDAVDVTSGGGSNQINSNLSIEETTTPSEPCAGVADGYYCAANLGLSTDKSVLFHCKARVSLSVSECPGQCDSEINFCGSGAGTGSVHKSDTASPCISCLESACNGERNACEADAACSAQWPCLTSCTTESCEGTCTYNFSTIGDDGQWRSCANHCASKCD